MKNTVMLFAMLMMSTIIWKVNAQYPNPKVAEPGSTFVYEMILEDLTDPSMCKSLCDIFKGYEWAIGEGVEGLRFNKFIQAYEMKKDRIKGVPCTPYFRVDVGEYYLEGQLFYDPITGHNALIRGLSGDYFAISDEYVMGLFQALYTCIGLPSSDWILKRTPDNLPFKVIKFTKLCDDGKTETITVAGLYYSRERYAKYLSFEEIPYCSARTVRLTSDEN